MKCPIHNSEMESHGNLKGHLYWYCYICNDNKGKTRILYLQNGQELMQYHLIEKRLFVNGKEGVK